MKVLQLSWSDFFSYFFFFIFLFSHIAEALSEIVLNQPLQICPRVFQYRINPQATSFNHASQAGTQFILCEILGPSLAPLSLLDYSMGLVHF